MWHLIFETRLPIGLGARSLKWDDERLPKSSDFLELVSLDSGSYWFTVKVDGAESAPLDFVPLIMLLDKHRTLLSTCTIKVGHRNPSITVAESAAHTAKTTDFVKELQKRQEAGNVGSTNTAVKAEGGIKVSDNEGVQTKDPKVKVEDTQDAVTASGSGKKASSASVDTTATFSATTSNPTPSPFTPKPVAYGKYIFGGRSSLDQTAPTSAHKLAPRTSMPQTNSDSDSDRDSVADSGEGWVDAINSQDAMTDAEGGDSITKNDADDFLAKVTCLMALPDDEIGGPSAIQSSSVQQSKSANGSSKVPPAVAQQPALENPSHGNTDSTLASNDPARMRDLITCRLPLLPRSNEADEPTSADVSDTDLKIAKKEKGKGKATARARTSFGLSLEDRFISADNTRESTPVLDQSTTSVPVSAATLSPSTRSRVASSYFADLCNDRQNTAATNGVLDIIQTEGVDLDSTLGLKLLELAKDLRHGGKFSPDSPYTPIGRRDDTSCNSWGAMMQRHEQSARLLEKVLDRLNDHSGMLNAIAEASGVNLLDTDSEADADDEKGPEKAVKTPTPPKTDVDSRTASSAKAAPVTPRPVQSSPQAALQNLLANAQTLPGAAAPTIAPVPTSLAQRPMPAPYIAICPPHPAALVRPENQMRPLPDTSPTSVPATAPLPAPIGIVKPVDLSDFVWAKVQRFAKSSAEARAKAEKEQHDSLQAHILDMYNLSKTAFANTKAHSTAPAAVPAVAASTSAGPSRTSGSGPVKPVAPTTPTTARTARPVSSPIGHMGLNTSTKETDPATQADFDYERYLNWSAHASPQVATQAPVPEYARQGYRAPNAALQQQAQQQAVPPHVQAARQAQAQAQVQMQQQQQQQAYAQAQLQAQRQGQLETQRQAAIQHYLASKAQQQAMHSAPQALPHLLQTPPSNYPPGAIAAATFHARMAQIAAERAANPTTSTSPPLATGAPPAVQARPPAGPTAGPAPMP